MKLVLIGAPGSGKGTRAKFISKRFGIPQISTGDLFRENLKNETEYASEIRSFIDKGNLVPNELTVRLLKERLKEEDCVSGYILDGFPRNLEQAKYLDGVDHVLFFDCSEDVLIKRLSGRRVCKGCGGIYHAVDIKPKVDGECDNCSEKLIQRDDDKEEVVRDRLKIYSKSTEPLLGFFEEKVKRFDASSELEDSVGEIISFLESFK